MCPIKPRPYIPLQAQIKRHAWLHFSYLSNNLHKNVSTNQTLCVCVCVCMLCMCVHGCVCVSVHQTGEEKNNPITETVCLNDIQYVHGKKERCV